MEIVFMKDIIAHANALGAARFLCLMLVAAFIATGVGAAEVWKRPKLVEPNAVTMGGTWGTAYERGLARLGQDPYTTKLILADVNFGMKRWFTNFSGDVSGRFLEVTSLSSAKNNPQPATLPEVMANIAQYQKADGHFGVDVDWTKPLDLDQTTDQTTMMPIMWGNGRLLLGLTAAYNRFGDKRILTAARKLGDFYVNTAVARMCDPNRLAEYKKPAWYAGNYVTCVYEGMEGLVQLYRTTKDVRYLNAAKQMADFHEQFDKLPEGHSHGSISQHEALILLYEETRETKYLDRVVKRWDQVLTEGYVNPTGGVLEKFVVTGYDRDEGCSEADWLRLNLMLWHNTGNTRYLDMAERELWCEYLANQWPTGGYGHRNIAVDPTGPYAYKGYSQEALWCCSFHGPLALYQLKGYLAVLGAKEIMYNFPVDFTVPIKAGTNNWTVSSRTLPSDLGVPVRVEVMVQGGKKKGLVPFAVRIPEWASDVVVTQGGEAVNGTKGGSYLRVNIVSDEKAEIAYRGAPYLETRRLKRITLPKELPAVLDNVVLRYGPHVLVGTKGDAIRELALKVNDDGTLQFPSSDADFGLSAWTGLANSSDPHPFVFNVRLQKAQ